MLFFEPPAGGGQIRGVDQSDRAFPPGIRLHQWLEQMLVDPPQSGHAQPRPKLVQHPHIGHPVLAAQVREAPPRPLLRQHFDQQVQGMNRREQTQQVNTKELGGGVFAVPTAGATVRPDSIDEIVGDQRIQEIKQRHGAGGRKVGIHARQPAAGNLPRQ